MIECANALAKVSKHLAVACLSPCSVVEAGVGCFFFYFL